MSIDIKSLRIGSHILVNGKRERVRGLDEDNGLIVRFPAEYVLASEVEPIAITLELLKELGFEWIKITGSWCVSDKRGGHFYATDVSDSTCVVTHYPDFGFQSRVVCAYLHELEAFAYLIAQTELIPD